MRLSLCVIIALAALAARTSAALSSPKGQGQGQADGGQAQGQILPRCVVDTATARQLTTQVCEVGGGCASLSVEWCAHQCALRNFTLAGVEAGHQCR